MGYSQSIDSNFYNINYSKKEIKKTIKDRNIKKEITKKIDSCHCEYIENAYLREIYNFKIVKKLKKFHSISVYSIQLNNVDSNFKDSYFLVIPNTFKVKIKDSLSIPLVKIKNNNIYNSRLYIYRENFKDLIDSEYFIDRINLYTYSTFWNKLSYKVGIIDDIKYFEKLKCTDFNKIMK